MPMLMYFIGLVVFTYKSKHLLLMLLSLEFIVVSLYYGLYLTFFIYDYENFFSMVFLTMSVCEGALGLSILVTMIRCYGNDYFNSFNILW
uniref:NADH dehydrogenase subunit 4L n=1 Tax=Sinelater perroti TaxID=1028068 RepID=UPI002113AB8B|nr:NADH dehydrogenase subunit 4L [Sinelater perroti]UTS56942.1 NADH dehydrogenase subunit 4L [Sinelater perroti]